MHLALTFVYTLFPILVLAGKTHRTSTFRTRHVRRADVPNVERSDNITGSYTPSSASYTPSSASYTPSSASYTPSSASYNTSPLSTNPPYNVQFHYEGEDFFSHWNFEAESDPTHGLVTYQSQDQAKAKGLASVKDGVMVLSVDTSPTLPTNGKRDSVRISSKQKWGQGLFIADFAYMPHGCGVWPAYWSVNSETWPNGGEIDILEGVNNQLGNQYTLHTGTSCALPSDGKNLDATSNLISYDCQTYPTDNRGCAFLSPDAHSYGAGFNAAGGGVVAHEWNSDHVRIWQFPRNEIPNDIKTQTPNPTSWGIPAAEWSSKYCDIEKATFQHTLVIDITLCGDWPNAVWPQSGCPGTCQQAITNSSNVIDAKWGINYITVFQS